MSLIEMNDEDIRMAALLSILLSYALMSRGVAFIPRGLRRLSRARRPPLSHYGVAYTLMSGGFVCIPRGLRRLSRCPRPLPNTVAQHRRMSHTPIVYIVH